MPEITRDQLLARLDALRAKRDQSIADANACAGAIAVLEALVAQLGPPDEPRLPAAAEVREP
jgi:hypothetical protein